MFNRIEKSRLIEKFSVNENASKRSGAMLVLIAVMMSLFLISLVFTVDVAYMQLTRTQLRVSADSAAKAGMEALTRTESTSEAIKIAKRFVKANRVAGTQIKAKTSDIVFGRADVAQDGTWEFKPNQTPYSAIQVNLKMTQGSINDPIPLFFGKILNQSEFAPTHTAVAANLIQEIILCLDRSHSMCFDESGVSWSYPPGYPPYVDKYFYGPRTTGSRWAALDSAIQKFVSTVNGLQIKPHVGVVTWGSYYSYYGYYFPSSTVEVPLGQDLSQINSKIAAKYNSAMLGSTNMSAGIDKSVQLLKDPSTNSLAQKTIILMSDGMWNTGRNPIDAATDAKNSNIVIHTISFINSSNQSTMNQVASITGGKAYIAPDAQTLQDVFEELAKTLPVVLID